eukprot:3720161-Pleurochrysis_carterae.AAC.1
MKAKNHHVRKNRPDQLPCHVICQLGGQTLFTVANVKCDGLRVPKSHPSIQSTSFAKRRSLQYLHSHV